MPLCRLENINGFAHKVGLCDAANAALERGC
jgi:hypothetical protein